MKPQVLGQCPVCNEKLLVTEIKCQKCGTTIKGEFELSPFDYLSSSQMKFAEVFLKDGGNIKLIEKELGISYPTVKKMLSDVLGSLGFSSDNVILPKDDTKDDILADLKNGAIDFDEAEIRLERIGEKI
jgi:hypothetical protein